MGVIVLTQAAPVLVSSQLKISGTLFVFAAIILTMFLGVLLFLPETKVRENKSPLSACLFLSYSLPVFSVQDLTLEKIEELFSKPWLERVNIFYYLRCSCFLECVPNCCRKAEATPMETNEEEVESLSSSSGAGSEDKDLSEVEIADSEKHQLMLTQL